MYNSLTITYSGAGDTAVEFPEIWGRLEQEYKESSAEAANLADLYQMIALARSSISAQQYVYDNCTYAVVENEVVTVSLDFYVWVHDMSLPYTLTAGIGTISPPEIIEEYRSFDVVFQGSEKESLQYIFDGTLTPEMPFIKSDGDIAQNVSVDVSGSVVTLSEPFYTVLRAYGLVTGYKHTVEMVLVKEEAAVSSVFTAESISTAGVQYDYNKYPLSVGEGAVEGTVYTLDFKSATTFNLLDDQGHTLGSGSTEQDFVTDIVTVRASGWKSMGTPSSYMSFRAGLSEGINRTGYKVENLQNSITLSYTDEGGEVVTDVLDLAIPPCVNDLLAACPDSDDKWVLTICRGNECREGKYVLYVNDCSGEPILGRWEGGS